MAKRRSNKKKKAVAFYATDHSQPIILIGTQEFFDQWDAAIKEWIDSEKQMPVYTTFGKK